jgi:hypothetical protein
VHQTVDAHLLIDVEGAVPKSAGLTSLRARRLLDTRGGAQPAAGAVRVVALSGTPGVPAAPFTAVVNLTTIAATGGLARVFTCGTSQPRTPTHVYLGGRAEQHLQLVRTDAAGRVCVTTTGGTHVSLDVSGWFGGSAGARGVRATRVLDTRSNTPLRPGVARAILVAANAGVPPHATGAVVTLTALTPVDSGTITVYPCRTGATNTTALTTLTQHTTSNSLVVGLDSAGRFCIRSSVGTQITVDVTGYTTTALLPVPPGRLLDTRA